MKKTNIELKLLVENIGFKYDKRLSSWLQNILQDKEDFARRFVITKRDKNNINKAKLMEVKPQAKILVENLCFLYIFKSFFPRAEKGRERDYPTYQDLKSGDFKSYFQNKASKLKNDLSTEGKRNLDAQSKLNGFFGVLSSVEKLDITKESIRELISKQSQNTIPVPFSPQELSAWNELVTLKSMFEESPDDMELLIQIAEKQFFLNEPDQAHDLLINVIEINPGKGNAWAILTKLYFDKYIESQKEHIESNARSEFMGEIPHPINSEERWINERIEDSHDQVITIRDKFINAAFNALNHWPKSESTYKKGTHYYNTYSGGNEIKLIRGWIFFHLTIALKQNDFNGERGNEFLEILGSFPEHYQYKSFPDLELDMLSTEYRQELPFQVKLTSILKFLSKLGHVQCLDEFILMFDDDLLQDNPERYLSSIENNLVVLSNSLISEDFWEYFGAVKYKNIYDRLYKISLETKEAVRLNVLAQKVKGSVFSSLEPLISSLKFNPFDKQEEKSFDELNTQFVNCVEQAIKELDFIISIKNSTTCKTKPRAFYGTVWLLSMFDFILNQTDASKDILEEFTGEDVFLFLSNDIAPSLENGFSCRGFDLFNFLGQVVKENNLPVFLSDQTAFVLKKISDINEELDY